MSAARQRGDEADAMMEDTLLVALPPQDIADVNAQIRAEAPAVANQFTHAYGLTPPVIHPTPNTDSRTSQGTVNITNA